MPLAAIITGANVHDKWLVGQTLDAVAMRAARGPRRPTHLCLDKGYDYRDSEAAVRTRRIKPHIRRRGENALLGCFRGKPRRWVVERTNSWHNRFGALLIRWEHRSLGPGFLEAIYEEALCIELTLRAIPFVRQSSVAVHDKGRIVGDARIDLLVANRLIVELKAIEQIAPIHLAQAMSYLKTTSLPLALLVNFNAPVLLRGVRRVILSQP